MMSLEKEILEIISPSASEKKAIEDCAQNLLQEIKEDEDVLESKAEVMLVGSVSKGTYLKDPDIDVFLLFPPSLPKKELQKLGLKIGKKYLSDHEERYAEHPYVHGIRNGYEVDIVPCYKLDSAKELRCAVDRTPFHTRYIKTNMTEGMSNQVRLLKQFAKGLGVYGAEAKVEGMSGYLIELLILRYGSFKNVLSAASAWNFGQKIFSNGQKEFPEDALVVYDPVDDERNVASALSTQSFSKFVYAAREYLTNPSRQFFFPQPRTTCSLEEIKKITSQRESHLVVIELKRPPMIDDNLYPQVRKTLEGIQTILQKEQLEVIDAAYAVEEKEIKFAVEIDRSDLPATVVHFGPPAWSENAQAFLDKWREKATQPYLEKGIWKVVLQRADRDLTSYLNKNLKSAALGKDFRTLNGLKIYCGAAALCENNMAVLSAMFDKRMNWEVV